MTDITGTVEGVHRGILSRIRDLTPGGRTGYSPVDIVEAHTRGVYAVIRTTTRAVGYVAAEAASRAVPVTAQPTSHSPRAVWLAGISAAIGDQLEADERLRALAPGMGFRRNGVPIAPADVVPESARRAPLFVFLHGLGCTEHQWWRRYREVVEQHGCTAAFVRYNTGRAIHANGADLADLLSQVAHSAGARGVPPIVLVGHSMGGLVACSALSQAEGAEWLPPTTDLITLGSPHGGAPMEKVAAVALAGLRQVRETRPLADFGDRRAAGIKDLRFGAIRVEQWGGRHPDQVLRDPAYPVAMPDHVRHHSVVARVGAPDGLLGEVVGDGLVRVASASRRHGPKRGIHIRLPETGHMSLLRHPRVVELLADVAACLTGAERERALSGT